MMNPGPGQGDRRRLAGQTGSSQVLYMCKCVEAVYVYTVQVMVVKMTIHKGTKGKR